MLEQELQDLDIPTDPRDAALDGMEDLDITGCGFGRRAQALMGDDDITDEERANIIRDHAPDPTDEPLQDDLPEEPDPPGPPETEPQVCQGSTDDLPEDPTPTEPDLPDETPEARAETAAKEAAELPTDPSPNAPPITPPKVTQLLRQVNALARKPVKPGSKAYYEQLATALAGIRAYLATAQPGILTQAWDNLLRRTQLALDEAMANPFLELPPIPTFWPHVPPGVPIQPIRPRERAAPAPGPAYFRPGISPFAPPPTLETADVLLKIVAPPPGLTPAEEAQWIRFYQSAPQPEGKS